MEWMELAQQYGPLFAACIWFVWRDGKREERLNARIEKLEDEQRSVILPLVEKATAVIAHNTAVIERLGQHEP